MRILLIIFAAALVLSSCTKNESDFDAGKDRVEFGTLSLRCISDCIRLYKLEDGKLYGRKNPVRFLEDLQYGSTPVNVNNIDKVIDLLNSIPSEILESEENYGCPGCVDEPFIYLVFTSEGKERKIKVDTKDYALKGEVKTWVNDFLAAFNELP